MPPAPKSLRTLLDSGTVHRFSPSVRHSGLPAWTIDELRGRVVELVGTGASALTTIAITLVIQSQRANEPVAWLTEPDATLFPPDAASWGVDLAALPIILLPAAALLRTADLLLRSGAFGLVLIDLARPMPIPLGAETRLTGLAQRHDAVLAFLSREGRTLGWSASLRAECERRRVDDGSFECTVRVVRDKKRGHTWRHVQACEGAPGLR